MAETNSSRYAEMLQKGLTYLRSDKGRKWLIVLGVIGILLLVLPEFLPKGQAEKTAVNTAQAFVEDTEKRLGAILSGIEGAGECRIMITLENGVEYVYATEQKSGSDRQEDENKVVERDDSEQTVIVVETENGREGLLVTEIQPTVKGVVVVCEGGDDAAVRERIISAVTVALNISSKRVCVTKLS